LGSFASVENADDEWNYEGEADTDRVAEEAAELPVPWDQQVKLKSVLDGFLKRIGALAKTARAKTEAGWSKIFSVKSYSDSSSCQRVSGQTSRMDGPKVGLVSVRHKTVGSSCVECAGFPVIMLLPSDAWSRRWFKVFGFAARLSLSSQPRAMIWF
jgi:hypothetical protein